MNKKIKTFAIYCSEGASRTLKFYSFNENLIKFGPVRVIYDGDRIDIIQQLTKIFSDKLIILYKSNLTSEERNKIHTKTSMFIHNILKKDNIEFLLCFGNKILKKELIDDYRNRLINFHPAILPSFKGLNAIDQALQNNVAILGNTAHYIDEGVDSGKIIIQTAMLREDFENYEDVLELQFPMMKMIFRDLLNYEISHVEIVKELGKRKKLFLIPNHCNI